MPEKPLSKSQARRFILAHQGLWPPRALKGESGVLEYLRRVRCIQFDPLNIVGHNHELVLQARVSDFRPFMTESLLYGGKRALVDGWDKMMSIYPIEDWPFFRRRREAARRYFGADSRPAVRLMPEILKAIEERGPLSSIDLDHDEVVDWPWAPTRAARAALESMYFWGELVIHHKVHTRKVYDLSRRHVPKRLLDAPDPNPGEEEFRDWYVLRRIRSIGLLWGRSGEAWLDIPGVKSKERTAVLSGLLEQRKIVSVEVEGIPSPLYLSARDRRLLEAARDGGRDGGAASKPRAAILAPLDNLLWDRNLLRALFGFDYVWEVYKPKSQRRFGYYVLPVLYGERFVARFEPGRDADSGALLVKRWWWEPETRVTDAMRTAILRCFREFLRYLGAEEMRIEKAAAKEAGLSWLATAAVRTRRPSAASERPPLPNRH